jgi:hypothetical protein
MHNTPRLLAEQHRAVNDAPAARTTGPKAGYSVIGKSLKDLRKFQQHRVRRRALSPCPVPRLPGDERRNLIHHVPPDFIKFYPLLL